MSEKYEKPTRQTLTITFDDVTGANTYKLNRKTLNPAWVAPLVDQILNDEADPRDPTQAGDYVQFINKMES